MYEERYIAAVDLGSSKIALTVAKIAGNDIQILYYKETPSSGIRNSAVFNPQKASEPIREIIQDAENELNIRIMQVVVGLPRCDVRQELNQASVERNNPDESITLEEVETLKSIAQDEYPLGDPDREILYGAVAQSFSDDEDFQLLENDIIGVISKTFEGNFKLFIGKKRAVATIDKVFNDLGIAIERKYFTPEAMAKAVLTEDEMESGVALVDFGGGATSVTIYKGKILRHYACIPFGGKVITSDIRTECSISETLAENIKLAYGACQPDRLQNLEEKILQIEGDETEGYKQIPVKYLSEIITARVKEIADAVLYEVQKSGFADDLRSGMVITGGGAGLVNIVNFMKELSGYNVRLGIPRHLFSYSDCPGITGPSATTSVGMILAAKADGLQNCIEAPYVQPAYIYSADTGLPDSNADTSFKDFLPSEDSHEEMTSSKEYEVPEQAAEPQPKQEPKHTGPEIPEDAMEGETTVLFSDKEVPVEKKKQHKKKERKAPPFTVKWKNAVSKFVGTLYDQVDNEEV